MSWNLKNLVDWLHRGIRPVPGPLPAPDAAEDSRHRLGLPESLHYPTTCISHMFEQSARRYGGAPAVIYGSVRWTYDDLLQKVNRLAAGLSQLGVGRGERVLFTLPNCPESITAFLAVQKLGGIVVNAGPLMGVDDLKKLIELSAPRVILALDLQGRTLGPLAEGARDMHWVWVCLRDYQPLLTRVGYQVKLWQNHSRLPAAQHQVSLRQLMDQAPSRPPTEKPVPEDTAVLQPTGGTTGTLKVAELSHCNLLANAAQISAWTRLRSGQERVLGVLPMFHVYGLSTALLGSIFNGATMIPLSRFRLDELIATILEHRPTVLPLVPAIMDALSNAAEKDPDLRQRLTQAMDRTMVISGAAALLPATAERFQRLFGATPIQGYGLTEASPVTHVNPPQAPRAGCIGLPLPDTHARVMSLQDPGVPSPDGEPGELWISGPQVMKGYYRNEEETSRMIHTDADGRRWLKTGDVVVREPDGYFRVVDRKKDMINRGGLKVWPAKVEAVLARHPRIADVAVLGRDDAKYGQVVVAVLCVKEPGDRYDQLADELRALCREHLATYEVPTRFEFVDQLPRTGLGKMQKFRLRAPAGEPAPPPADAARFPAPTLEEGKEPNHGRS